MSGAEDDLQNWWVSWWHPRPAVLGEGEFELHWPWWVSEHDAARASVVAGIRAATADDVRELIRVAYDTDPGDLDFRFVTNRSAGWSPYDSDRFPRANWMPEWPAGPTGDWS